MIQIRLSAAVAALLLAAFFLAAPAFAQAQQPAAPDSPRVIVELETPPLAAAAPQLAGRLDTRSTFAQDYVAALQAEQAAFASTLQAALPTARVSTFTNELGVAEPHQYQIVFNGMAISVDGARIEAGKTFAYKGMMYSGVPNLASSFGYTNASWTLKCDLTC